MIPSLAGWYTLPESVGLAYQDQHTHQQMRVTHREKRSNHVLDIVGQKVYCHQLTSKAAKTVGIIITC